MKYKSVIEIVSDACDKEDALDTAGEYLRGQLVGKDIKMKCKAEKIYKINFMKSIIILCVVLCGTGIFIKQRFNKNLPIHKANVMDKTYSAIQPPLRTSVSNDAFIKNWEDESDSAILRSTDK